MKLHELGSEEREAIGVALNWKVDCTFSATGLEARGAKVYRSLCEKDLQVSQANGIKTVVLCGDYTGEEIEFLFYLLDTKSKAIELVAPADCFSFTLDGVYNSEQLALLFFE